MEKEDFLYKELSYRIRGVFFEVYKNLGTGFKESIYCNAIGEEFNIRGIPFKRNRCVKIRYKEKEVGIYTPDFIVEDKIIIEVKALPVMQKICEQQLYYYLKGTIYKIGFLVNFGADKLEIRRRIYDTVRKV